MCMVLSKGDTLQRGTHDTEGVVFDFLSFQINSNISLTLILLMNDAIRRNKRLSLLPFSWV